MSTLRFIPLDASESAVLRDNQSLLPLPVYQQLAVFITEALKKVPDSGISPDINTVRSHNAVSVDGARGTGKTWVLVNLRQYLENDDEHRKLLRDIHIFSPIDPTLLEENESLFLHIIVAALLSDKAVQDAQRAFPDKRQQLDKSLEALASALTSVKKQNSEYGMAKLRLLFGNQRLAGCVQDFFKATLDLLDKKLLVLPIDDVDTSLNRAFENLEIIRRYLTTPYVLPIVSGDRNLYREVTWRDFHGRITKESNYKTDEAYIQAVELAEEYQRKLLPLPRRLEMPDVSEYLKSGDVVLGERESSSIPLNNFFSWLQIFIGGPVNGLEGSQLELPVYSIRALTQLINKCGSMIPELPAAFRDAKSALQVQRAWQMPEVSNETIQTFQRLYNRQMGADRDYNAAYKIFAEEQLSNGSDNTRLGDESLLKWERMLRDYFRYEPKAGAVTLVLLASQHWQSLRDSGADDQRRSVFDTPLFQPLRHEDREFSQFDKSADFSEWTERLYKRLPESWLTRLHSRRAILPYPVPEIGVSTGKGWPYWQDVPEECKGKMIGHKMIFLASLSMHYNFYTASKQSFMVNIGRIVEIILASLVGDVRVEDLQRIVQNAPFFSASALAPTKTLNADPQINAVEDTNNAISLNRPAEITDIIDEQLIQLHADIAQWRLEYKLDLVRFSPWMIYNVFNKVYSQFANTDYLANGAKDLNKVIETVGLAFYSTWSAFGSFEKGPLFGLPDVIARVNLSSARNFERSNDHFNINLGPFVVRKGQSAPEKALYGKCTRTASYYLAEHPIRLLIEDALSVLKVTTKPIPKLAKTWLANELGFEKGQPVNRKTIEDSLSGMNFEDSIKFINNMERLYPDNPITKIVRNIINEKKAAK